MKIFDNNGHSIIWGDTIFVLENHIADKSVDLIFVDPPYNIGKNFNGIIDKWKSTKEYLEWSYKWINLCIKKLKDNGTIYLMTSTQNIPYFDIYLRDKMQILSRIIWAYDSSGVQARKFFGSLYEPILFAVKDKNNYTFNAQDILVEARTGAVRKLIDYRKPNPKQYNSQKVPGNVWYMPRVRYRMPEYEIHPSQKPVSLLERIIKVSSNKDDLILDPFAGTFTTCYVAQKLGRKSIGIDIVEEYIKIGLRRLKIITNYNNKPLKREPKIYERKNHNQEKLKL